MNITKITNEYINNHPSIRDCIKKKAINYSALARIILKEAKLTKENFDAIVIACRRYAEKESRLDIQEEQIIRILKSSKLEVKTKIAVAILYKTANTEKLLSLEREAKKSAENFHLIEGTNSITILLPQELLGKLKKLFKYSILKIHPELVELIVKSPKEIEFTHGLVAYLSSLLAEHNINIVELASCWTDTIIVIEEEDLSNALKVLSIK